jgi:hypothetical protein
MKYLPILLLPVLLCCHNKPKWEAHFTNDTSTITFENLPQGDSLMVSFGIWNSSEKTINILHVSAPYNNITITSVPDTIAPGKIGDLAITYRSNNDTGLVSKTFVVETSDSVDHLQTFHLRGNVVKR